MSILDEMFASIQNNANLQNVGFKSQKSSIYNPEIFSGCITKAQFTKVRNRVRKELDNHISNFISCAKSGHKSLAIEVIKDFLKFYEKTYNTQDFTIGSIVSNPEKKENGNNGAMWVDSAKSLLDCAKEFKNPSKK